MSLRLVPVDWETICRFTSEWHRHHKPPTGWKFGTGVADDDDVLRGVASVGRCVAAAFNDGMTLEVNRTATDGYPNANSMLYGAAARATFAMGYRRLVTYTQEGESGSSLKAAGWHIVAQRPARKGWDTPSRRRDSHGVDNLPRTLWETTCDV